MKNYRPRHLYECYMEGDTKRIALFERVKCNICGYIWNPNNSGEDCPKCSSCEMTYISMSNVDAHIHCGGVAIDFGDVEVKLD